MLVGLFIVFSQSVLPQAQAQGVLEKLAQGMSGIAETEDARAALRRLKGRG